MMGAVDRDLSVSGDAVQQRARAGRRRCGRARCAGSAARARAPRTSSGICWIRRAAEDDVQQLLAAADAEHRLVAGERAACDRHSNCGALGPSSSPWRGALRRRKSAGSTSKAPPVTTRPSMHVEIGGRQAGSCGRGSAGPRPGHDLGSNSAAARTRAARIAAGLLGVEGHADTDGLSLAHGNRFRCAVIRAVGPRVRVPHLCGGRILHRFARKAATRRSDGGATPGLLRGFRPGRPRGGPIAAPGGADACRPAWWAQAPRGLPAARPNWAHGRSSPCRRDGLRGCQDIRFRHRRMLRTTLGEEVAAEQGARGLVSR